MREVYALAVCAAAWWYFGWFARGLYERSRVGKLGERG